MMETEKPDGTVKDELRGMRILVIALIIGVVIMAVTIIGLKFFVSPATGKGAVPSKNLFLYMSFGIAFFCLLAAWISYKKKLAIIKGSTMSLRSKLAQYRSVVIMYMALCEGAALFSVIAFFIEGKFPVLIVTAVMLVFMLRKFPLSENVIRELELDWQEQQELIK